MKVHMNFEKATINNIEINLPNNWDRHKNDIADCTKYVADAIKQDKYSPDFLEKFLLQIFKKREWLQSKEILSGEDISYVSDQLKKIEQYFDNHTDWSSINLNDNVDSDLQSDEMRIVNWRVKKLCRSREASCIKWNPKLLNPIDDLFLPEMLQQILSLYAISKIQSPQ